MCASRNHCLKACHGEGDVTCVCMPLETADDCGEKTGTFTRSCVFANDDMGRKVG